MKVENKNVVITGSSSGIGYELMKQLLDQSCKVVASSRTISKSDIENENLYKFDCNLSSEESVDKLFEYAISKLGSIDLYIANAGFAYYEKIGEPSWAHLSKIYNTNTFSVIYAAEKMKSLLGDKPYNFVVTASAMSFFSLPGYAIYSSTKAALRGFADGYRYELSKGQNFELVYPIATKTKFFNAASDMPVAWPLQDASYVANKIINSIRKNKKHIFPSKIFSSFKYFVGIIPPLLKMYNSSNNSAFKKWLKDKKK